ncbi:MAG: zinc/manganese transport system permease protein [Francisellaceae bacterium]|jgi:zinc/manganese transport system permease protein
MLEYSFMQHAFISGTIIAFVCGWISTFVILRRSAFAAHALGHTSLTGAAGAVLIGVSAISGQLIINLIAAFIMGLLGDKVKKNDLVIGIVLTFFLGLGAYFLFLYQNNYAGGVMSILFGNILAVSLNQIYVLCLLALIVIFVLIICMRPLLFASIDPTVASAKKVPIKLLNIIFFLLLAITVSMGCQIVGVLLVFALMVVPGAVAAQWCKQFYSLIGVSIIVAIATVWISLTSAFYLNLPTSVCITTLLCFFYFIGLVKNYIIKFFE